MDFREQEARNRQEQAQREREQAKHKKQSSTGSGNSSQTNKQSLSGEGYQEYKQSYQQSKPTPKPKTEREKAFEVLDLEPTAAMEEAKRARNKLMSLYHPDRLAGLPEGRRKQAEEEAKKINVAWSIIKK
ncbi:MAG: DnaJ-domain-containing protein 1 [Arenicella sp.]|jgi:DnaJ-domain-containing protein 1